jgi:hypothetical protein
VASKDTHYGYEAGWMDAREIVMNARQAAQDPDVMAALRELWESMGPAARDEKREAYAREVESY